tara:strand:- start:134450 stop:135316 length:867 start_codon:yes stop_codon:yes gene_type:complete
MYRNIKKIIFSVVLCIYILLILKHQTQLIAAATNYYYTIILATLLSIIGITIQAINYIQILNRKQLLQTLPTIRIWSISNLTNYIAPFQPGLLVRAKYFKHLGIDYIDSSMAVIKQIHYNFWVAIGLISLTLPSDNSTFIFCKYFLAGIFFIWLFLLAPLKNIIGKITNHRFSFFINNFFSKPTLLQAGLCTLHYFVVSYLFYFILTEFGLEVSFNDTVLLSTALVLSSLVSITPNNLGVQEIIIGLFVHAASAANFEYITLPFIVRLSHIIACTIILSLTHKRQHSN